MKTLLSILSVLFLTNTAHATYVGYIYHTTVDAKTQVSVTKAVKDVVFYSKHQNIVGSYAIRAKALNTLNHHFLVLDHEMAKSDTIKGIVSNFAPRLIVARDTVTKMIALHNTDTDEAHQKLADESKNLQLLASELEYN
jgi:hypothetical protein